MRLVMPPRRSLPRWTANRTSQLHENYREWHPSRHSCALEFPPCSLAHHELPLNLLPHVTALSKATTSLEIPNKTIPKYIVDEEAPIPFAHPEERIPTSVILIKYQHNHTPPQNSSSMNYTSRFAFCNILVPDPILVPINTVHQNCSAQSETCHHGTVFTGRTMPWQMFPVKHPQCIRLQLNADLQPGRSCKEDAKGKKHYN